MRILNTVKRIPGGLMIVPLLLGVLVTTFTKGWIWETFEGTFTQQLWYGTAMPMLAIFLFCNGTQIKVKTAGETLYKGVVITTAKVGSGLLIGLLLNWLTGGAGVLGLSTMVIVAAFTNSNGGLYATMAGQFGDESDVGATAILAINDGPFFTMLALGVSGFDIPITALAGCIIPILVGMILGNLDDEIAKFCAPGTEMMIPFIAFPLGSNLTLSSFFTAGGSGVLLGVACVLITGLAGYGVYKLLHMPHPQVGAGVGTTAGNAVSTPAALLAAGTITAEANAIAIAQISTCTIITAILCPLLVSWLDRVEKKRHPEAYCVLSEQTVQMDPVISERR